MSDDAYATYLKDEVFPAIATFSAFMALSVVLTMIGFTLYDKKLVDRVSLRLQTAISCLDIWFHTLALWIIPYSQGQNSMCTFIAWQVFFGFLLYSFLNVSIGVNLQLVFLQDIDITRKIEIAYWIVPIVISFIISIIPLAMGKLGYGISGCLTSGDDENNAKLLDAFALEIWIVLSMIYLFVISLLVIRKLRNGIKGLKLTGFLLESSDGEKYVSVIKRLIYRILLYPAVMIITQLGNVVSQLYYDTQGDFHAGLDNWGTVSYRLSGVLNFIAFCCDPTLQNAVYTLYRNIRYGKSNLQESNDYNLTPVGLNIKANLKDGDDIEHFGAGSNQEEDYYMAVRRL